MGHEMLLAAGRSEEAGGRCVVASLADPNTFLFDHLLSLKPVKCLAGELKHEDNLRKMKLLSFMQLAENRSEITFEEIRSSIQINEEEVEEFLIDVIKTKLVRAKLAQDDGIVYVSSTMHRTFGREQWQQLHQLLNQ